jgi:hypothetical protein
MPNVSCQRVRLYVLAPLITLESNDVIVVQYGSNAHVIRGNFMNILVNCVSRTITNMTPECSRGNIWDFYRPPNKYVILSFCKELNSNNRRWDNCRIWAKVGMVIRA